MIPRPSARVSCLSLVWLALLVVASCRQPPPAATPAEPPLIDLLGRRQAATTVETRYMSFGAGDRSHLVSGWSVDERDVGRDLSFVWAIEPEASVSFEVLQVEDAQVLVTMSAFPTDAPQRVTVLANGHEVTQFTVHPVFLEYRFVVPAAHLVRGKNIFTFRHSTLGKPANASPESRSLAVAYHSILMGPQCLPLRGFETPVLPAVERLAKKPSSPLRVTGPATITRRFVVPSDAVLRLRLALPARARAAAAATLSLRDDVGVKQLRTRLARTWFGGRRTRDLEVDLSAWAGKTIDLDLEVGPDPCRASVATITIEQAGVFAARGTGHPG